MSSNSPVDPISGFVGMVMRLSNPELSNEEAVGKLLHDFMTVSSESPTEETGSEDQPEDSLLDKCIREFTAAHSSSSTEQARPEAVPIPINVTEKPVAPRQSDWETKLYKVCSLYEVTDKDCATLINAMRPIERVKERLTSITFKSLMSLYIPHVTQARRDAVADTYLNVLSLTK